ncbi:hypothetical protein C1H46_037208 [Malus baccata]|uniref:Arginine decarboxylase n=1 Tax=Malus baccata TaxID=106549 RepID=A0A540KSW2_MALBA|nr:hypothetical protein C1H46_037208 [Malus baccata]
MSALACCVDVVVAHPASPLSGIPLTTITTTAAANNSHWSPSLSSDLYRINAWGGPYFTVNSSGNVVVRPQKKEMDLLKIVKKVSRLLRSSWFFDLLKNRLESVQGAFNLVIWSQDYGSYYQGVYPMKCNQDRFVVEDIVKFGSPFRLGLEAGSKLEPKCER